MNIYMLIILLSIMDVPALPEKSRATRRASRAKAIARNRRTYNNVLGPGKWYDIPDEEGYFRFGPSWKPSIKTRKAQQGRWATDKLSGHRRYAKCQRDYYPSGKDTIATARWDEELKEYLNS